MKKNETEEYVRTKQYVEFHCYDVIGPGTFEERFVNCFASQVVPYWPIVIVETHLVRNYEELDTAYEEFLANGYEGMIIRNPNAVYQFKRTKDLLKRKEWIDDEFEIVDIQEGTGNRSNMAGTVVVKLHTPTSEGETTCRCGIIGGYTFYKKLLNEAESLIGKMATVCFFNYTTKGSLRFPRVKCIRDYE